MHDRKEREVLCLQSFARSFIYYSSSAIHDNHTERRGPNDVFPWMSGKVQRDNGTEGIGDRTTAPSGAD